MDKKNKAAEIIEKSMDSIVDAVDQNDDGRIDLTDVIIVALKTPGVGIKRASYLKKELTGRFSEEIISKAINSTPLKAGISRNEIDEIVKDVIKFERTCVSGISAALSMPGGPVAVATIPADVAQYYGYMLRAAQKMLYLYGFQDIELDEDGPNLNSRIMNTLILCLGAMYGVKGANNAIKAMASAIAKNVEKQIMKKALTKGTWYPIVRNVLKWFGINLTKKALSQFFTKAIPVAGAVVGGGITYLTFESCCNKLQATLRDTILSNPDYKANPEIEKIEIIEED